MLRHHQKLFKPLLLITVLFSATVAAQQSQVTEQSVAKGLYELAYSPSQHDLYVASAGERQSPGGAVYVLDAQTLHTKQVFAESLKPFGVALNDKMHLLYTGNSRDGAITAIDSRTGKAVAQQVLASRSSTETAKPRQIREIIFDPATHQVYATGVGAESVLWVLDGKNLKVLKTITDIGKMATGMALDPISHTLYLSNASGELVKVDTKTNSIVSRTQLGVEGEVMLLNISLDSLGHRAFISDFKQPQVLVVDTQKDQLISRIAVPESIGVLFSPKRHELYVSHRKAGSVSIVDTNNYQVKQIIKTTGMPNSLALSATGDVLYVSVKQPASRDKPATEPDSILRVAL